MKAKFNSPIKIFSSVETKYFLATLLIVTVAITISNYVWMKQNRELRKKINQ
jgi:hypothetical protein